MKEKTRKILKRVGAGFLLGLSFLNFGTGWGKQKAKSVPRRAQNIRKETKEELDAEIQQVADIAENEAQNVINQETQEQQQQQQMQVQQQAQTQTQQFLRYATIGGWGIAMAVFFTSMIFNSPFGLGKAVLSVLPGEPHVAILSVVSKKSTWQIDDEVVVDVKLATNQEKANYFKVSLQYDPKILKFQKIRIDRKKFDNVEQNRIDQKNGKITFIIKKPKEGEDFKKDVIAQISFKALTKSDKTMITLLQKNSLVLKTKKKDGKGYNILGKTISAKLKITNKFNEIVKCQKVDVVKSRMTREEWERLIKGAPVPLKDGNNWVDLNDSGVALLCAYSEDGGLYVLLKNKTKIKSISLNNNLTGDKAKTERMDNWTEGSSYFQTVLVNTSKWLREKPDKFRNIVVNVDFGDNKLRWPEKGSAEFILSE
jgi:hypothetical protein